MRSTVLVLETEQYDVGATTYGNQTLCAICRNEEYDPATDYDTLCSECRQKMLWCGQKG